MAQTLAAPDTASLNLELRGTLGAGKTTFARHLLRALGVRERIKSPSYALLESYDVLVRTTDGEAAYPLTISHFDFYRLDDPRHWDDTGFREVLSAAGLKLIEWPEKVGDLLPAPDLRLNITLDEVAAVDGVRRVCAQAMSVAGLALLRLSAVGQIPR